ncbi:MAG: 30S ribosomal protein S1 [Acidobacteria bacterium]|nr:30S ribosomal protein S1 [Acidobacteriota bacterium]
MSSEQENPIAQPSVAQAAEADSPNVNGTETLPPSDAATQVVVVETSESPMVADPSETSTQAMEALIEQYSVPQQAPSEGQFAEGRILAFSDLGIVVDIGAKSEGLIPAQEFMGPDASAQLQPGQTVEVQLTGEEKDGYLLLSYQRARRRRAWENIEKSHRNNVTLTGRVVDRIKGGLVVDIGVRAFLPASQLDLRPTHDLDSWKGQEIPCRVVKMNRKRGNVVVSRRVILEEEIQAQRQALMDSLVEGAVMSGKVKSITEYGVFVDLGGLDGLLHVTDLSWGRLKNPAEAVSPGQELEVKVLKFDREKMRVSLGHKQLLPDPWVTVAERYAVGMRVQGRVVGITDYGAFVELEPGVEGLVHVSEMSWSKRAKHPSKILSLGDAVEVMVLDLKMEQRRISLGLKQTMPDPWQEMAQKYPVGSVVTGRIRNLTDFGAFLEIEDGFDGLIHVSDISWTNKVKNPADVFKKGDKVEARVLKIDTANRRVSLGVKQVNDIWADWFAAHHINDVVRGKVSRLTTFGAFVELAQGIEGLCHVSEIEDRRANEAKNQPASRGGRPSGGSLLQPGQEYDFKIIKISADQHKIGLSYRAAQKHAERREMHEYRSSKSSSTATIGDAILAKRESL